MLQASEPDYHSPESQLLWVQLHGLRWGINLYEPYTSWLSIRSGCRVSEDSSALRFCDSESWTCPYRLGPQRAKPLQTKLWLKASFSANKHFLALGLQIIQEPSCFTVLFSPDPSGSALEWFGSTQITGEFPLGSVCEFFSCTFVYHCWRTFFFLNQNH